MFVFFCYFMIIIYVFKDFAEYINENMDGYCPRAFSVPRNKQFSESEVRGKL